MLEKINDLAEKLATTVGPSRRGFLVKAGQAAIGAVGALLALPGSQAEGARRTRFCMVVRAGRTEGFVHNGLCLDIQTCHVFACQRCIGGPVHHVLHSLCAGMSYDAGTTCSF